MHRSGLTPFLDSPPLERYGLPAFEQGASPAVATDFTQVIDSRFRARLVVLSVRLVTDANVANREVTVDYLDAGGVLLFKNTSGLVQAASLTRDWCFSAWQPANTTSTDATLLSPLSPLLLEPTFSFRIHVLNAQAADQLSRVRFTWERFYTQDTPRLSDTDQGVTDE